MAHRLRRRFDPGRAETADLISFVAAAVGLLGGGELATMLLRDAAASSARWLAPRRRPHVAAAPGFSPRRLERLELSLRPDTDHLRTIVGNRVGADGASVAGAVGVTRARVGRLGEPRF